MAQELPGKDFEKLQSSSQSLDLLTAATTTHGNNAEGWSCVNATMSKMLAFMEMMEKVQADIKNMVSSIEKYFTVKDSCNAACNINKPHAERSNCNGGQSSDSVIILKSFPNPLSNEKYHVDDGVDSKFFTPHGQPENEKADVPISTFKRSKGKAPIETDLEMDYVTPLGDEDKDNMEVPLSVFKRRKGKEVLVEGSDTPYINPHTVRHNEDAAVPKSSYKRKKTSSAHLTPNEPKSGKRSKEVTGSSKKLFPSPTGNRRARKKKQIKTQPRTLNVGTGDSTSQALNLLTPTKPHHIPKKFRSKFRPSEDMGLGPVEHAIALYVYGTEFDERELLFRSGEVEMTRKDFWDIRPGMPINREIVELLCKAQTSSQCLYVIPNTWCLPPSFTEEVLNGMEVQQALAKYGDPWMPGSTGLRYIYVPICENKSHWHLLVVSLFDKAVYWLDSYQKPSEVHSRLLTLRFMQAFLSKIILEIESGNEWRYGMPDISKWELKSATGIPNCGDSSDSVLWVCDWIDMENFFNPHVLGKMNGNAVIMRIMLKLVMAKCHCVGKSVEAAAGAFMRSQAPATI